MTVREMRARMGADEYQEWVQFYSVRPFGQPRAEARHGDLLSSLWALHGGKESPKEMRSSSTWQFSPSTEYEEMDPEIEAAMMLAKMGG